MTLGRHKAHYSVFKDRRTTHRGAAQRRRLIWTPTFGVNRKSQVFATFNQLSIELGRFVGCARLLLEIAGLLFVLALEAIFETAQALAQTLAETRQTRSAEQITLR